MIKNLLNRQTSAGALDALQQVIDVARDSGPKNWLSRALPSSATNGISRSQMRSILRSARRGAKGMSNRTSAYVMSHPRRVGLGVGAAAAAAIGLYAFARMKETRKVDANANNEADSAE